MNRNSLKVLVFMFILATISCTKEAVNTVENDQDLIKNFEYTYAPTSKMTYGNFNVENGTMIFETKEDLVKTLQALANNVEFDIISYQEKFDENMTSDEVIALLDENNWDENQTFIDFEMENNFSSLRPVYEEKSRLYGEGGLIESDPNNPANCLPFESLPILTLLNIDAVLGISGKLYKFLNNGLIYEITDGNTSTALAINESHNDASFTAINVKVLNAEILSTNKTNVACFTGAPTKKKNFSRGSYKSEIRISLTEAGGLFSLAESKIINWKRVGSTYRKRKASMSAGITNTDPDYCSLVGHLNSVNSSVRYVKTRSKTSHTFNAPKFKVAEGKVFATNSLFSGGQHYYPVLLK